MCLYYTDPFLFFSVNKKPPFVAEYGTERRFDARQPSPACKPDESTSQTRSFP